MNAPQVRQPSNQYNGNARPASNNPFDQQRQQDNQNWAKQNQAWASGQGTAAQQAQGKGWMQQQNQPRPGMVSAFGGQNTHPSMLTAGAMNYGAAPQNPSGGQPIREAFPRPGTSAPGGNMVGGNPYGSPTPNNPSQWNMQPWNPQQGQTSRPNAYKPPNPAGVGGVESGFFGAGGQNFYNPESFVADDSPYAKYINTMLPVATFGQNNFQYRNDFNEAQRRWESEFGATQGNNQFQQGLSARQQQSAEEQARLAQANWGQQFGHTQNMDYAGLGLSQQEINNQYAMGMDQNAATRDVANTYAGSNRYQADQGRMADMYGADQQRMGNMYGADRQMQGQLGAADTYARGGMYEADQGLRGQLGSAEMGMRGQLGAADIYGGAQRYGSDQELAAAKYQWDMQQRMNQAMMENNLQVANTQAYGRSQAPQTNWARSWS
jgi:hypothetical protein